MLLCSLVQFARIVIVRVILVGVLGVMIVVLIGLDEVLVIYVAIFVVIFCIWRCTLYRRRLVGDFSESDAYASLLRFSHLSRVFQAGAHFSALDGQQLLVVEGSAWRGRQESDYQALCRPNSGQALFHMEKHMGQVARQNHDHHDHHDHHEVSGVVSVFSAILDSTVDSWDIISTALYIWQLLVFVGLAWRVHIRRFSGS